MKKVLFTAMILTVLALGCASNQGIIAASLKDGALGKCKDCVVLGSVNQFALAFNDLAREEMVKYKEEEYTGEGTYWEWAAETIYEDGYWYFYVIWLSKDWETQEMILSLDWMFTFVDESQRNQDVQAGCLSKLRPVAKVVARAIVEKLTWGEIREELDVAIRTVDLSRKK